MTPRRARLRLGVALTAATSSVGASYLAMRSAKLEEHERVLAVRLRRPRGPAVDRIVSAATDLGSLHAVAAAAIVLAARGRRDAAVDVVVAAASAWVAAQALKRVVRRPRPYQVEEAERLVAEPAGSSWPSGHPAVAAAAVAALAPQLPPGARLAGSGLAGFVAVSRVYVGVHYPTDVIAGLGIGGTCAVAWLGARRTITTAT